MQEAPVWEIAGAEFTQSTTHTAAGVSIRFPRVTRIRDDKDWETATDLDRLKVSSLNAFMCYTLNSRHLSNEDSAYCLSYLEMCTKLPLK